MISQKFQIEERNTCVTPARRLERCEMKTMSDFNEQEMDLVCEAVMLADPARRSAFLDQACAGNSNLRTRIEEFLVIDAEAEKFFARAELATHLKNGDI